MAGLTVAHEAFEVPTFGVAVTHHGREGSAVCLPLARNEDGVEFKSNPWRDPADGRFAFAGSGLHVGTAKGRPGAGKRREQASLPIGTRSASATQGARPVAASVARPVDRPNPAAEFARSAAGGLDDTAAGIKVRVVEP